MVQFKWNNNVFSVSKKNYQRIKELSESFKIKKKSDGTSSTVVITGSELQTFSFDIPIINTLNSDPRKVYELWRKQLGMSAPMLAQDALFGPNNVRLNKVSLKSDKISNAGVLLFATLTLTFEEDEKQGKNFKSKAMPYISPIKRAYFKDEPQAVENLILKVFYNEKDITDAIDVNTCIHDMYACSRADSLLLTFNDVNKVWDKWKPNKEELISIVCGVAKSGRMFIESVTPENGLMTLIASSCPPTSKKKNNKSWENIWFLQLGKEIADRHNLAFESYGVQDRLYSYVRQENEPDFDFLQKRCELESCAFVVYDKKLVIYSEEYLENQDIIESFELGDDADFKYVDNELKGYGSLAIKNGELTGTYTSKNGLSRTDEKSISTYMSSQDEANRFAKGILRQENKNLATGTWKTTILRHLSAGSIFGLKTTGANSWDGKAFISHLRNDYVNSQSKVFFRKAEVT